MLLATLSPIEEDVSGAHASIASTVPGLKTSAAFTSENPDQDAPIQIEDAGTHPNEPD